MSIFGILWGFIGLFLLTESNQTSHSSPFTGSKDYVFSIEAISQKAYGIDDSGINSELYFVYGSRLSDGSRYHTTWTHTRQPDIQLKPNEYRRMRVPIVRNEVILPAEYMVVNIGIMEQDCDATSRSRVARSFVPIISELPDYTPYDRGQYTPTWSGMKLTVRKAPNNDIRLKVLPPEVNLNDLRSAIGRPCRFSTPDDLLGYFSMIVWNDPFAPSGQPLWDYYCDPAMCRTPFAYTADTLMIHTQYDNLYDVTFRISMKPRN